MAAATAGAGGPIGGSPIPRALNGPMPSPLSSTNDSIEGISTAVGIRYWAKVVVRFWPSSKTTRSESSLL